MNNLKKMNEYANKSHAILYSDVSMVHPINSWTFWYRNPTLFLLTESWEESIIKVGTVGDVTDFWK